MLIPSPVRSRPGRWPTRPRRRLFLRGPVALPPPAIGGTSYYVPPRPVGAALGLLALVSGCGGMGPLPRALSGDEARAVASASRGYPCSTYFIDGYFPDEMEGSKQDADPAEEE